MRFRFTLALLAVLPVAAGTAHRRALPLVRPNSNVESAGTLQHGVLSIALVAKESQWIGVGSHQLPLRTEAFAEVGKSPLLPGPFIRVPEGTEIRFSVHNTLSVPLTFLVPTAIHGGPDQPSAMDSLAIAPGAVAQLTTRATVPGNYVYRAKAPDHAADVAGLTGALSGAIVIDSAGSVGRTHDRVLVISAVPDSQWVAYTNSPNGRFRRPDEGEGRFSYTINGRMWPNTERITATAGDTLHWRVINVSAQAHPMHLHGFYFRVDALTGPGMARFSPPMPGQMVVTELLPPLSSMSMTWSPDRPGNWLFHCHFALHLERDFYLNAPADGGGHEMAGMRDMSGLVMGVIVAGRPGVQLASGVTPVPAPVRQLRLIAEAGPALAGGPAGDTLPSMHFVLEEQGHTTNATPDMSPELDLTRGEPVSITIVNHLAEPTSVHWHGIEVADSYVDGVPDFSGTGDHLAPAIAPGDSFVAQFTPPRSGTFMYHAHVDEVREQLAGLEGALIVRDPGAVPSSDDHIFFLKGLATDPAHPIEINGQAHPDTVILHAGRPARLRFLNLATVAIAPVVSLIAGTDSAETGAADAAVVQWRPIAKDGFDIPIGEQRPRPARQIAAMGETYDFEYVPVHAGNLRLEIRSRQRGTPLIIRVPVRVE